MHHAGPIPPPRPPCAPQICYHGPLTQVLPLFEGMGFACPLRKGVADFLQEVTTATDQKASGAGPGWLGLGWAGWAGRGPLVGGYHAVLRWREMLSEAL